MSADLVQAYFRRDLDAAEEESLAQLLQASPEAAARFAALAAADYRGFGLTGPDGNREGRAWHVLPLIVLGIGLLTALTVLWKGRPQASRAVPANGVDVVQLPEAVVQATSIPEASRLLVQAQTARGPFEIRVSGPKAENGEVFDARGRRFAALQRLDSRRFRWDGRDEEGHPAPPGPYQFRVDSDGQTLKQWVEIEAH
jgi:hypothetical protein